VRVRSDGSGRGAVAVEEVSGPEARGPRTSALPMTIDRSRLRPPPGRWLLLIRLLLIRLLTMVPLVVRPSLRAWLISADPFIVATWSKPWGLPS
jgi:hypothetical protein